MAYPSGCLYFYSVSVCSHLLVELGEKMWVIVRQESNCENSLACQKIINLFLSSFLIPTHDK